MTTSRSTVLTQGFVGGLIGYALVATSFAAMNLLAGHSPLLTATLLGRALFGHGGVLSPATDPGPIIAFNGIHLILFVGIGTLAAWLLSEAELHPRLWYLVAFAFIVGFIYSFFAVVVAAAQLGVLISPWTIAVANLVAAAGMGAYLAHAHPHLRDKIERRGDPEGRLEAPVAVERGAGRTVLGI